MRNKIILVVSILVAFVVGFACANLVEVRIASAKSNRMIVEFERLDERGAKGLNYIQRARVPGGWFMIVNASPAFIPDPNYQWK